MNYTIIDMVRISIVPFLFFIMLVVLRILRVVKDHGGVNYLPVLIGSVMVIGRFIKYINSDGLCSRIGFISEQLELIYMSLSYSVMLILITLLVQIYGKIKDSLRMK